MEIDNSKMTQDCIDEDAISLREIIQIIVTNKVFAIMVAAIVFVGCIVCYYAFRPSLGKASTILEMNFAGIGQGNNPDGTKFDLMNEIKSPKVAARAISKLGWDKNPDGNDSLGTDYLRNSITVEPIIPGDITKMIEKAVKDGKNFAYHPNRFIVSMPIPKGKGLNLDKGKQILDALVDSYIEIFHETYSYKDLLSNNIKVLNTNEYDYPDIAEVFSTQITLMKEFIEERGKESGVFRSAKTGYTFNDILVNVQTIDNLEIRKMEAMVSIYNLTKDKQRLIDRYEFSIKKNELQKGKKEEESRISREMMNNFKQEKNSILIPGVTGELGKSMELEKDETYYDKLAERSVNTGVEAVGKSKDNDFLRAEILKLRTDTVSPEVKKQVEGSFISIFESAKIKLDNWIKTANDTTLEYYSAKFNKAIEIVSPVESGPILSLKNLMLIALVMAMILGLIVTFAREYWKNSAVSTKE